MASDEGRAMRGLLALLSFLCHQYDRPEALKRRQGLRLRKLVAHAYAHVPYYRRLLDEAGVRPESIRTIDDIRSLPITSRRDRQQTPREELTARNRNLSRCYSSRTSGATGIPLEIVGNRADRSAMNPSFIAVYLAWGASIWDRLMFIQARPQHLSKPAAWYERLRVLRRRNLFAQDDLAEWVARWRRWQPSLLQGYALTLKLFAERLSRAGISDVRARFVVSTSGTLDQGGRRLIERAFGARVIDVYASEEAGGVIAWQCPSCNGFHVNQESVVVEVLEGGRPAPPGTPGEVVITNLANYTMPFIRYQQGDVAVLSEQAPRCGRQSPLLAEVQGRAGDCVVLSSGRRLTPHPFFLLLDELAGIAEWRLVQTSIDELRVEVCGDRENQIGLRERIVEGLRSLVGPGMRVAIEFVDGIHRDPSRKLRSVVCEIGAESGSSTCRPDADADAAP